MSDRSEHAVPERSSVQQPGAYGASAVGAGPAGLAASAGVAAAPASVDGAPAASADGGPALVTGAGETAPTDLEAKIVTVLQRIYDPEIPVNIYDLGLIYGIDVYPLGRVTVRMTLTSPACPVAGSLPPEVEQAVRSVDGVSDATVELVWDPPWTMDMMSEEAKLELNLL